MLFIRSVVLGWVLIGIAGCNGGSKSSSVNNYTVGGAITGLSGTLTLQNSGADPYTAHGDGSFVFGVSIPDGSGYSVTVQTQPVGQTCTVANGVGTINAANVSNVAVTCVTNPPTLTVSFGLKQLQFSWNAAPGATFYRLFERADAGSAYVQIGGDLNVTAYAHDIAVHKLNWTEALYSVQACNVVGCTVNSTAVSVAGGVLETIGYVKASARTLQDVFGASVALSADGNTLAVGAPAEDGGGTGVGGPSIDCGDPEGSGPCRNAGAVYVYARVSGAWQFQSYIKSPTNTARDHFGTSVALSANGDVLAVGAPGHDGPPGATVNLSGAVYVYRRTAGAWSWDSSGYLRPTHAETYDSDKGFGAIVAINGSGTSVAVGVPLESSASSGINGNPIDDCGSATPANCANSSGAVYVFACGVVGATCNDWSAAPTFIKRLAPSDFELFGYSVAFSKNDNLLAVGATRQWNGVNALSGAVHIFDTSTWNAQIIIPASSDADHFDQFGTSVALSEDGSTIAVGADTEDSGNGGAPGDNASPDSGAVYVFTKQIGGNWAQQAYLKASNISAGDRFGSVVSLSSNGDTLAVGAPLEGSAAVMTAGGQDDNSVLKAGAAYVFARSGGAWTQVAYVKAPNTESVAGTDELPGVRPLDTADQFGAGLALSGDGGTLAVAARYEDGAATHVSTNPDPADNGATNAGAVYLY